MRSLYDLQHKRCSIATRQLTLGRRVAQGAPTSRGVCIQNDTAYGRSQITLHYDGGRHSTESVVLCTRG